jgi:hypothetical protein
MSDESVDRITGCYIHGGTVEKGAPVYNVDGPAWAVTVGPGGFIEVLGGEMHFGPGAKIRALDGGGFVIEGTTPEALADAGHPGPVPSNSLIQIPGPSGA